MKGGVRQGWALPNELKTVENPDHRSHDLLIEI